MNRLLALIASVRTDKWLHALGSVVIFAFVHYFTRSAVLAFGVAVAAHAAKKANDIRTGALDPHTADGSADLIGDMAAGVIGAALAWGCLFVVPASWGG